VLLLQLLQHDRLCSCTHLQCAGCTCCRCCMWPTLLHPTAAFNITCMQR
jgi:hypothetical protein